MNINNGKNKLSASPLPRMTSDSSRFGAGVYEPKKIEKKIYSEWEKSGFFNPDVCVKKGVTKKSAKPFSIVLPPPNVTGRLHIGHALTVAIEDLMVRYHRMKGFKTLWVPGTDHAAIATQSKVEKIIFEKEGKTRHDLGREKFLQRVERYAAESHDFIVGQLREVGCSLDWSREVYTLDQERNLAVRTTFKKMYDDGIIYRGHRIVNWDPKMQTTVSDEEVERKTETTTFYYLKYGPFVISTARPETKFGDKYVVMHPKDKRYKNYQHGQKIDLEWINGPVTATVIKDEAIDMEFGTGVMTITPWHDAVDFDIAERHNLDKEQIIDYSGKLLSIAGEFSGMDISEAREKIVAKLDKKGLVVKKDPTYVHDIAINSRGGGVIEPQIKEQWFVGVNKEFKQKGKKTTLKKLMREAVSSGKTKFVPKRFEKIYYHWIDNLHDWCISRQLWYGHRIPVWYREKEIYSGIKAPKGKGWMQDPDTLDTWFSSGLWTFSTLGWPSKTADLKNYHPTSVLETGYDILFFWVSRMILMSTYCLGEVPFRNVYLHGMVRDEHGKKMSKSLGNVIEPEEVIMKYGTDAVRLSLILGSTPGNDLNLSEEKMTGWRNFTNKFWNIGRYIEQAKAVKSGKLSKKLSLADEWILGKLNKLIQDVTSDIDRFQYSQAGEKLRDFTWNDFADWYVEIHKIEKNDAVLQKVFETLLKLWHPFIPFITEELFRDYRGDKNRSLMVEAWPQSMKAIKSKGKDFEKITAAIIQIRNIRAIYKIDPKQKLQVQFVTRDQKMIEAQKEIIEKLARVEISLISTNDQKPKNSICIISNKIKIYALLEGVLDLAKEKERLVKEIGNLENYIGGLSRRLENKDFVGRAPKEVVEKEKNNLETAKQKLNETKKYWDNLN
jgi:valyl-tRNA synthetase